MSSKLPKIIVILGPTASGKSSLALEIAKEYNGEIVNADSRQIYKEMNIGTAKPVFDEDKYEVQGITHHLFDIRNPSEEYSVVEYKKDAIKVISDTLSRGKLPIVVGGTGFYIQSIVDNIMFPDLSVDFEEREKLNTYSLETLLSMLEKESPTRLERVDKANKRKVIRALELSFGNAQDVRSGKPLFIALQIGVKVERDNLRERIHTRVLEMIENGLVEEVTKLREKYGCEVSSMDAIGYRQICTYLENKCSLNQAIEKIKNDTWHYAKRQITWFKRDSRIHWIHSIEEAKKEIRLFLAEYTQEP